MPCLTTVQQFPQLLRRHVISHSITDRPVDLSPLLVPFILADAERDRPAPFPMFPFRRLSRRTRRTHRLNIRLTDILLTQPPILSPEPRVIEMLLIPAPDILLAHNAG